MKAVLALGLLCVGVATAQYAFCQRVTGGAASTAVVQEATIKAIVVRAFVGAAVNLTAVPPVANAVPGLINLPLNKDYFLGVKPPMVNFVTNAAQQAHLVTQLTNFFMCGLGCLEGCAAKPFVAGGTLKATHAAMMINAAIDAEFAGNLLATVTSFGVVPTTYDTASLGAMLGQFGRGGGDMEICSAADCAAATTFAQFRVTDTDGFWAAGSAKTVKSVTIKVGGTVAWDLSPTDNVVQTESSTSTTATASGWTSGAPAAGTMGFTKKFDTAGTYYWYSDKDKANRRGTVVVESATPAAAGTLTVPVVGLVLAAILAYLSPKWV